MKAEIITIGDEILRGEIVDSNKALLAERLRRLDIECHYQSSVRDDRRDMRDAFRRAVERSDVVLVSGGLGPTRDDITSEVLAETFGRELLLDAASLESIRVFFQRIGREMSQANRKQACFPSGAEVLPNPAGTAPGFALQEAGTLVFCMPGVPRELGQMMDEQVLPRLEVACEKALAASTAGREAAGKPVVRARLLRTFGMGESSLEEELADIARDGDVELGFRTTFPDNYLRVVARAASASEADNAIERVVKRIHDRLGPLVYGEENESMAQVVGRLLAECGKTIALAESCTGGLVAQKITDVPGSSSYFLGGVVAYANSAKVRLIGVPESLLAEHGAVSEPVVRAMAEGVRERFRADLGLSVSGISGPDGGTPEKPLGLVFLALARGEATHVDHFVFPIERSRHRTLAAQVALDWVRRSLLGLELTGPSLLRQRGGGPSPGAPRS